MKNKALFILSSIVVILSIMACSLGNILPGGATETPIPNTPVVNTPVVNTPVIPTPASGLTILSTSSFADTYGFYVFGELANNLDTPVSGIELSITITDASGESLLQDDNGNTTDSLTFYAMLWTLDAGESSPFSYYINFDNGTPANFEVTVSSYASGTANRADLQSENVQMVKNVFNMYVLTGELVNLGDQWVNINSLTGGGLDDANTVLSADWISAYASRLAPAADADGRDRTPFYVSFPVPTLEATQWSLWWDADIETDVTDYPLVVEVTNTYLDEYGSIHLVGLVTNNADTALNSQVMGGLFAADGTVLDASYSFLPLTILPGLDVPFDIYYYESINWTEEQADLVDSFSVQIDPGRTYPPYQETVGLTVVDETIWKSGAFWTVTGNFNNTTARNLSVVTVMVAVYDSTDRLVAMGYTYSYPSGDTYAPGDNDDYEIYLYLDPDANSTGYTTRTFMVADVSE